MFSNQVPPTSSFFSRTTNVDAGLLQPVRGEQARHAAPMIDDAEVDVGRDVGLVPARRRGGPRRGSASSSSSSGRYVGHVGAADGELHDAQQRRRRTAAAPATQPPSRKRIKVVEGERACRRLLLLGQPALGQREEHRVGAQVVAQQRQVAGDVGERGEQRRELGLCEGGPISSSDAAIGSTPLTSAIFALPARLRTNRRHQTRT